jgi:hypothetical protein
MKLYQATPDFQSNPWENLPPQEMNKKILAVTGFARSGKGSLCDAIEKNVKVEYPSLSTKQFAFAEALRRELAAFILENFGIDAWTSEQKKKEIIRPILIGHGMARRKQSDNQYWIKKLEEQIKNSSADLCIINDLRFDENENDELAWLKKNKGLHFHIRRYSQKGNERLYQEAPNEYEKANEEKLISSANHVFDIPFFDKEEDFAKEINKISLEILSQNIIFFL